jgi:leucyl/phenylalanyl-tRNA--protein transferase
MPIFQLSDQLIFPHPELAEENGLLAIGGDLSIERLLLAYRNGIFPWYSEGDPVLWWAPPIRYVIDLKEFRIPRRFQRALKKSPFRITIDTAFEQVIRSCASTPRRHEDSTWINEDMIRAYTELHLHGFAHSIECRQDTKLVGGLYGVSLGGVFFGESMFSTATDSSKTALVELAAILKKWDFDLIDCQIVTDHLRQFGAREMDGCEFQNRLRAQVDRKECDSKWLTLKNETG